MPVSPGKGSRSRKQAESVTTGLDQAMKSLDNKLKDTPDSPEKDAIAQLAKNVMRSLRDLLKAQSNLVRQMNGVEAENRKRVKAIFKRYQLEELGFRWDEDFGATENAVMLIREIANRLACRYCFHYELYQLMDKDDATIAAKARELVNLNPPIAYSEKAYETYLKICKEILEETKKKTFL